VEPTRVAEASVGSEPTVFFFYIDERELPRLSRILRKLGVEHEVEVRYCG